MDNKRNAGIALVGLAVMVYLLTAPSKAQAGFFESDEEQLIRLQKQEISDAADAKAHKELRQLQAQKYIKQHSYKVEIDGVDCIVIFNGEVDHRRTGKAMSCNWEKYNSEEAFRGIGQSINDAAKQFERLTRPQG